MPRPLALVVIFLLVAAAYVGLSYMTFKVPVTLAEAADCGFLAEDFNAAGQIDYPPVKAWWVSFTRQQEYFTAISIGAALTFVVYALFAAFRIGSGVAAGAAMGGSVLALSALCVSCLAPALSIVGLGIFSTFMAGVPKWLIALNTLALTGWGAMFLSRRLASCPLPRTGTSTSPAQ